jgi:septal ring factor EnvC (AmiA/AmiB activator)
MEFLDYLKVIAGFVSGGSFVALVRFLYLRHAGRFDNEVSMRLSDKQELHQVHREIRDEYKQKLERLEKHNDELMQTLNARDMKIFQLEYDGKEKSKRIEQLEKELQQREKTP